MLGTIRRYLIRALYPISRLIGHVYMAPKAREIRARDVDAILEIVRKGDVLITYSVGEFTNILIEGEYKHCAVYIGLGYVVEAVGHGVHKVLFDDFCASKDKIAVCRPLFCGEYEMSLAAEFCSKQIGKPYDYSFEPTEDAFYCAELAAEAYKIATNGKTPFLPRKTMGVDTVLPVDFKLAVSKFKVVVEKPAQVA
jgi:uncharacterized protein YycO